MLLGTQEVLKEGNGVWDWMYYIEYMCEILKEQFFLNLS